MNTVFNFRTSARIALAAALAATLGAAAQAGGNSASGYSTFSLAQKVVEVSSDVGDGCPIETADGLSLFIASNRTGTAGGNDIWAADRASLKDPWGTPRNLGPDINTSS
jgi:hypothetical protein